MLQRVCAYIPTNRKSHSRVNIARTELGNGAGQRQPSRHLSQGRHQGVNCQTRNNIAQEDRKGAGLRKGSTNTEEQAGTNGAAEGDELNVS